MENYEGLGKLFTFPFNPSERAGRFIKGWIAWPMPFSAIGAVTWWAVAHPGRALPHPGSEHEYLVSALVWSPWILGVLGFPFLERWLHGRFPVARTVERDVVFDRGIVDFKEQVIATRHQVLLAIPFGLVYGTSLTVMAYDLALWGGWLSKLRH